MVKRSRLLITSFVICVIVGAVVNIQYLKAIILQLDRHHHSSKIINQHVDDGRPLLSTSTSTATTTTERHKEPPKKQDIAKSKMNNANNDKQKQTQQQQQQQQHKVAGLNCDKYGGPFEKDATDDMVYWRDIPKDAVYPSPFANYGGPTPKYLTFEPDEGGWNNIRMSMETATALAHAMGRILVLPYEQNMYLLRKDQRKRKNRFTFHDFFHFDSIQQEHQGLEVISMKEFIMREAMTGQLHNKKTGIVSFPPENRTVWDGHGRMGKPFYQWLRNVTEAPIWFFNDCVVGLASEPGPDGSKKLREINKKLGSIGRGERKKLDSTFKDNPTPVDGQPFRRLLETLGQTRSKVCIYNEHYQNSKVIHFMGDNDSGARLLTHFYTYMFFEDYRHDLWIKRFVRDHLRYVDEIQCAAARIVQAVRQKAIENGNPKGIYDSFHIRRGDFQYKQTRIEADEIYNNTYDVLEEGSTVFIATDEQNMTFFNPLRDHYHIYFLHDFEHLIPKINKNYYGMLDQRIASRGRTFVGAFFSTFTGYINRMRGYHSQKEKLPGHELGRINSYFYVPINFKHFYRHYHSMDQPFWAKEFPLGWRDIDHDLKPEDFADVER